MVLVVLVIFLFLRNAWATAIPSVAMPLSLVSTFAVMYLLHYSIDNLSLMALTIATGFVVDDAIVVIENIARYLEAGYSPEEAAFKGSQEIGFTVMSMSTSLVAVFIPILLMGGIVGRLFREFAVTLTISIAISLLISLTTTPMLCAKFLKSEKGRAHGKIYRASEAAFNRIFASYRSGLQFVLRHQPVTLAVTLATLCLSIYLYVIVPKGFFPQQDTGRLTGSIQASQDISFEAMRTKLTQFSAIVAADPAVDNVVSFTGGGSARNSGRMFAQLKPLKVRQMSADLVIARLRKKLGQVPGATLFLQSVQDIRIGGRQSNSQYQYTLEGENLPDLLKFAPLLFQRLKKSTELRDVSTDQQTQGLELALIVDRDTASRLGITPQTIDDALYDAFGQRQVSTMYSKLNQYHVVMEVAPEFQQDPEALKNIYVRSGTGQQVPSPRSVTTKATRKP